MKISELVNTAYRKIGVLGHGQPITAEQSAAGVEAFNLMLTAWVLDGIDAWLVPGQQPLANMNDFDATADFPLPPAFREGAAYCLASRLAPEFSAPVNFNEEAFLNKLRNALAEVPTATFDGTLLKSATYPRWWYS